MTYVERRLHLRNGPPWGFRLYEDLMEGLMVSKIRRRSPADMAGMREGDHIVAINGMDALDMSHNLAVQTIDSASYFLEIIVGRFERSHRTETIYLDNEALRAQQTPQEITTTELQLFWEKETPLKPVRRNWPPPKPTVVFPTQPVVRRVSPPPKPMTIHIPPFPAPRPPPPPPPPPKQPTPETERKIIPNDPDVSSVSVKQLMREFDVPPIAPELRKKNYADSSFYSDPSKYYPTIEEQMEMARRVADSLQDPQNSLSRGANMFERQRIRAEKHIREGPDPQPDPIAMASPEELENMAPPTPPPPPPPPPPSFPGLQPMKKSSNKIPPPPILSPGQPKTVQEFLEKIKVFPANRHTDLDPQKCFDIASALYNSDSRGAKMFARKHARAKKWDAEAEEEIPKSAVANMAPEIAFAPGPTEKDPVKAKLISKLSPKIPTAVLPTAFQNAENKQQENFKISLTDDRQSSPLETPLTSEGTPKPFGSLNASIGVKSISSESVDRPTFHSEATSETSSCQSGWRPVKFKLAQTAS